MGGLVKVKWGCEYPFNKFCPKSLFDGKKAAAGNVAVALAQLMTAETNRWPQSYHWNNMIASPNIEDLPEETQDEIARLIYVLGLPYNLGVEYNSSSGFNASVLDSVPQTLHNMGYTKPGTHRDYWFEMIHYEIDQRHPVLMQGYCAIWEYKNEPYYLASYTWIIHGLMRRVRDVYEYWDNKHKYTRTEVVWYIQNNWCNRGEHDGYFLSKVYDPNEEPEFNDTITRGEFNVITYPDYRFKHSLITEIRK